MNALISFLFALNAHADTTIKGYDCDVTLIAGDLVKGWDSKKITIPLKALGSTHGGEPIEIVFQDHTLTVLADGTWRAISWSRSDVIIAEVVTAAAGPYTGHHALIVYNPANREEQAYLSCMPQP